MSSSGAVSPMTRAMARVMPVPMPAAATGSTTFRMVRHLGTPRAYDASRSSAGTSLSISSDARTTTGVISTDSATAPPMPKRTPGPTMSTNSA